MAKKTKQTLWGDRLSEGPDATNLLYCAGRDVAERPQADALLFPFDIYQNQAHVTMLAQKRIISKAAGAQALRALHALAVECRDFHSAGHTVSLPREKEDVHTYIESRVAELAGSDVAGVIHTARSRNDQTTTVVRMFVRQGVLHRVFSLGGLIDSLITFALRHAQVPVAGYTHYQPGSITTVGHWMMSHAASLLRDAQRLSDAFARINVSPLGAAASFGTTWPIDREATAEFLGFDSVQANTMDCITNRWEMEAEAAQALAFMMTHLSILAQDLMMLSFPALGVVRVADRYVTGSSIMPQKRNPDFAEVTRAKAALVQQLAASLFSTARGLFSGYNRDTQWTKYTISDILAETDHAAVVFAGVIDSLTVDAARAKALAGRDFVDAVDYADLIARKSGVPFRQAYNIASRAVAESERAGHTSVDRKVLAKLCRDEGVAVPAGALGDAMDVLSQRTHTGGPAPAAVRRHGAQLRAELGAVLQTNVARAQKLKRAAGSLDAAMARMAPGVVSMATLLLGDVAPAEAPKKAAPRRARKSS